MTKFMSDKSKDVLISENKKQWDAPQPRQGLVINPKPSNHIKISIYYRQPLAARNIQYIYYR